MESYQAKRKVSLFFRSLRLWAGLSSHFGKKCQFSTNGPSFTSWLISSWSLAHSSTSSCLIKPSSMPTSSWVSAHSSHGQASLHTSTTQASTPSSLAQSFSLCLSFSEPWLAYCHSFSDALFLVSASSGTQLGSDPCLTQYSLASLWWMAIVFMTYLMTSASRNFCKVRFSCTSTYSPLSCKQTSLLINDLVSFKTLF